MIECGDYVVLVAEDEDRVVGFVMAQISEGYVFALFVRPYEGHGIGRRLMDSAEDGLRRAGVTELWLSTGADPALRAQRFYHRLGWREDGVISEGQVIFRKQLADRGYSPLAGDASKPDSSHATEVRTLNFIQEP